MDQAVKGTATDFTIIFAGEEEFSEETIRRSEAMVRALLNESDAPNGEYQLRIKGRHPAFEKFSSPHLEVVDGMVSIAMQVMIHARNGADGSLCGSLYPPEGANRAALLKDMKIAAGAFNQNGDWAGVLHHLPPNPPPERTRSTPQTSPQRVAAAPVAASSAERGGVAGPAKDLPPVSLAPPPAPVPVPPPAATDSNPDGRQDNHARFLIRVLEGKLTGEFTGVHLAAVARICFSGESTRWYSTGVAQELLGRHWIRRVDQGLYQVEQSFLDMYPLFGLTLVPRPKLGRQKHDGRKSLQEHPSVPAEAVRSCPDDLVRVIRDLQSQRAELVATADADRLRSAASERVLSLFDDQLRETLGTLTQGGEALKLLFVQEK